MRHFIEEKKGITIDLYFDTGMTSGLVLDNIGYPLRQCVERLLQKYCVTMTAISDMDSIRLPCNEKRSGYA